ncbi:zinc finger protein 236-like [Littorina saxatilis]|uniref:zinc finger protein 236-like n=1 Tax=Littorina saxatilis TaxID=31220 RepID=UPI0038B5A2D0
MSRRKQTKPHHFHSDSEDEEHTDSKKKKLTADTSESKTTSPLSTTTTTTTTTTSPPHDDKGEKCRSENKPKDQREGEGTAASHNKPKDQREGEGTAASHNKPKDQREGEGTAASHNASSNISAREILRPPKKRGRPPSFSSPPKESPDYSKSHNSIATALTLAAAEASPRRHSSRLHPPSLSGACVGKGSGKKMSHRTCEYCGVVKPTPAALQRHVRKHTGERPFVCQVCHKAYKAKRSLHCHQITNHPELLDDHAHTPLVPSDLDPASNSSTVSSATSHLLRETLETRRMARQAGTPDFSMVPDFVKTMMAQGMAQGMHGQHSDMDAKEFHHTNTSPPSYHNDQSKSPSSLDVTQDLGVNVATLNSSLEDSEAEGEENCGDLARRSCPHCHKVFSKPSDMKRHLMVHTGERPHVCQNCNKGFKQLGSLNYHLKATHNLNIPLSQGLEERYLRLKTRSAMRSLAAMDGLSPRLDHDGSHGGLSHFSEDLPSSSFADSDSRPQHKDTEGETHPHHHHRHHHHRHHNHNNNNHPSLPLPPSLPSCSSSSYAHDFQQGLTRQTSLASEGSWMDERTPAPNVVEVELPQFWPTEGSTEGGELTTRKVKMSVRKEAVLFTQLDGVCSASGQAMQVFRCCLCDKVCASMFFAFSHLAMHLEGEKSAAFQCRVCCLTFKSQPQMADHFLHKHGFTLSDLDLQNNNHNFSAFNGEEREEDLAAQDCHSGRKSPPCYDDLNNNDDNHVNKEYHSSHINGETSRQSLLTSTPHTSHREEPEINNHASTSSAQPQPLPDDSFTDGPDSMETSPYPSKGSHRCPKCSKCYMTQFLLDRHMAFHTRQDLIQAAMKSGAKVNGVNKDLLLQPPPVLPQDSSQFLRLKELSAAQICDQKLEEKASREDEEVESSTGDAAKQEGLNSLDAKALLEKEGIEEDVTVVMPSDPDLDEEEEESPQGAEEMSEVQEGELSESEIRSAPKRHLIPYRKDNPPAKSRRKASLPHRFRSAVRDLDRPHVIPSSSSPEPPADRPQQPPQPAAAECGMSSDVEQQDQSSASQSCSSSPQRTTESPAESDEITKEFQRELLRAQQSTYLHNFHAAFSKMPSGLLGNRFPGNGFPAAAAAASSSEAMGLYVVNQPVDRERLCKPTVLPDGRTVFRCIFCHKDFLSYSDINRHMDFHEDIRPYKCNFCDYYARTNSQLKVHMMRHQGIREYCCRLCNYKGVTQSDLNRHMKSQIHLLKARNECGRCHEGFVTAKNLEKHVSAGCDGTHRMDMEKP